MPTLAKTLAMTTPVSPLLRKARRLGLRGVEQLMALAIARGCRHYVATAELPPNPPSREVLSDNELTTLLLIGENAYEPMAIRCAAQLARSEHVNAAELARLAGMEKVERVLTHVAKAGLCHDPAGVAFWQELLARLPALPQRPEPMLPHWSRFVSMPGKQRGGMVPSEWLVPGTYEPPGAHPADA